MVMTRCCRECGKDIGFKEARAEFCGSPCRFTWNNRRGTRGAELYDLFMTMRYERPVAKSLHIFTLMCRMAARWHREDGARQSYMNPFVATERLSRYAPQATEETTENDADTDDGVQGEAGRSRSSPLPA